MRDPGETPSDEVIKHLGLTRTEVSLPVEIDAHFGRYDIRTPAQSRRTSLNSASSPASSEPDQ